MLQLLCRLLVNAETSGSKIAQSLEDDVEAWTFDTYYATHRSGIAVWIANSAYGLHVQPCGRDGVDRWTPSWAERQLINKAANRGRARYARQVRKATTDALAEKLSKL